MRQLIDISTITSQLSNTNSYKLVLNIGDSPIKADTNSIVFTAYIKISNQTNLFIHGQEQPVPPNSCNVVIWDIESINNTNWQEVFTAIRLVMAPDAVLILWQLPSLRETKDNNIDLSLIDTSLQTVHISLIADFLANTLDINGTIIDAKQNPNNILVYTGKIRNEIPKLTNHELVRDIELSENKIHLLQERINWLSHQLMDRGDELMQIRSSTSWIITRPIRSLIDKFMSKSPIFQNARRIARTILAGNKDLIPEYRESPFRFGSLLNSIKRPREKQQHITKHYSTYNCNKWGIIVTPHTIFIGKLMIDRLTLYGWNAELLTEVPETFQHDMYIVVCPQMFKILPPPDRRICFQMEQSVSQRWFSQEYLFVLHESLCVLDYSINNIEYLSLNGIQYPKVFYVPVGARSLSDDNLPNPIKKTIDILFYGDVKSSPRRQRILSTLQDYYNITIIDDKFGLDMEQIIKSAKIVLNIHYYENALLEMPRIQECLSLGVPVVSESSQDQDRYPELGSAVTFFDSSNVPEMISIINSSLSSSDSNERVKNAVKLGQRRFGFMFDRFLVAMRFLEADAIIHAELLLPKQIVRVALSMPETVRRRTVFEANQPENCEIFDGIRARPGWVGCALSYKTLAHFGLSNKIHKLTIMEDDVLLPIDFEDKWRIVNEFLDSIDGQWDCFCGLIATVHPTTEIIKSTVFKGVTFLTINKMTSMVCNIYSTSGLQIMSKWDMNNHNDATNTIDKYLENQAELRVVVAIPFVIGHREDERSTLWGFKNITYTKLIQESQETLISLASNQRAVE